MTAFKVDQCGSCGAEVIWCTTTRANLMPVNREPAPDGTITIEDCGGMTPLAKVLTVAQRFGRTNLRTSHFATCPDAKSWRRGRAS